MEKTRGKKENFLLITVGLICGFVNGFFGGGGGMVVVPLLILLAKFTEKEAHATAILIILPLTIISGIVYSVFGNVEFNVALPVAVGVTAGGIIGAVILKKIQNEWLKLIFSVIMVIAGIFMLLF